MNLAPQIAGLCNDFEVKSSVFAFFGEPLGLFGGRKANIPFQFVLAGFSGRPSRFGASLSAGCTVAVAIASFFRLPTISQIQRNAITEKLNTIGHQFLMLSAKVSGAD